MPARRATSSMVSSCTGVVGSSSSPICTSCARRSPAERRSGPARGGGHRPSGGRPVAGAAASSRSIASDDQLRALLGQHVPGPLDDVQRARRAAPRPAAGLCRFGRELVAVADQDLDRHPGRARFSSARLSCSPRAGRTR